MIEITNYCAISGNRISVNGQTDFVQDGDVLFTDFIKAAYRNYKVDYPKFFKMDNLSKLAFIAAEVLLKDTGFLTRYQPEDIGMLFQNGSSSLDSDLKHAASIKDKTNYFPSPAVFVYTLPNIMIGELCIRHKIKGENTLFISQKFDAGFLYDIIDNSFTTGKIQSCLGGWIECGNDNYQAFLFLAEKKIDKGLGKNVIFTVENLTTLYHQGIN